MSNHTSSLPIQDPPGNFPWIRAKGYRSFWEAERQLTADDFDKTRKSNPEPAVKLSKVCFFVIDTIPAQDWKVHYHTNCNKGMAATLMFSTKNAGSINLHNGYNHGSRVNIDQLVEYCDLGDNDILLGDFNLHHENWTGDPNTVPEPAARVLVSSVELADLKQLTPVGAPTFAHGDRSTNVCTTIDLTYASERLCQERYSCTLLDVRAFESDHSVIRTRLNIQATADDSTSRLWDLVDCDKFIAYAEEKLKALDQMPAGSKADLDAYAEALDSILLDCIEEYVPTVPKSGQACRRRKAFNERVERARQLDKIAADKYRRSPSKRWKRFWDKKRRDAINLEIKHNTSQWRLDSASRASRPNGIYQLARMARVLQEPRSLPQAPDMKHEGSTIREDEDKVRCIVQDKWPSTSEALEPPTPVEPKPSRRRVRRIVDRELKRQLKELEIEDIIKKLSKGKAAGPDKVNNEAIRLLCPVILKYLERLFTSCLLLSYHPQAFKTSITVMIPKTGKALRLPGSWRPIALLSCVGKILEKVIADRLQFLVTRHNLLPRTQYGLPGKSTVTAIQYLLNPVYCAWCLDRKLQVSLLSIDIKGAFDRVNREKLIEILEDFGIPEWLVDFVASFLSTRSIVVRLPGVVSRPIWVQIGIPQGSPLSPLLFLFYTAPMLERISVGNWTTELPKDLKQVRFYAFAYIDDTYIMAVSPSYKQNCQALEFAHDEILKWANSVGATFSTGKYHLIHFKPPWSHEPDCKEVVSIEGFDTTKEPVDSIKILGVIIDRRLRWTDHIDKVIASVNKLLGQATRFSGSFWGPPLVDMVKLYTTKILPTITYACGAWFVYGNTENLSRCLSGMESIDFYKKHENETPYWSFTKTNLDRLRTLQYRCLLKISGAIRGTSFNVLLKELSLEDIEVTLHRYAVAHRAKVLDTPEHAMLARIRNDIFHNTSGRKKVKTHPFVVLDKQARLLGNTAHNETIRIYGEELGMHCWNNNIITRNIVIRDTAAQCAKLACKQRWEEYLEMHSTGFRPPIALYGYWRKGNRKQYKDLTRAQSTMLMQCRTERIGLNAYLHSINLADTPECPCGTNKQTVFHMFIQCPRLELQRQSLRDALGVVKFSKLMTTHSKIAADWAIANFELSQYQWVREHILTTPSKKQSHSLFEGT